MNGPSEDSLTPQELPLGPAPGEDASSAASRVLQPGNRRSNDWLRRLFACNPFYLVSVALLLFGCYRISMEPALFNHEAAHLFFNFTSLQVYEFLLVATAIFLARRRIWYDSTLLAGIESLLALVPFILISQAALIDRGITWELCVIGAILALTRLIALKRWITELNLPSQTLTAGILLLIVNSLLPAIYRHFHESKFGNKPDWGAAYQINQWVWWLVLPVLCGAAAWSARLVARGELWPQKRWLPLAFVSLWLAGTGVHVYCLDYVYDFTLRPDLIAPVCWTVAWLFCWRISNEAPALNPRWRIVLLSMPLIICFLAFAQPGHKVFVVLTGLNIAIYRVLSFRRRDDRLPVHLMMISAAALIAGFPEDWVIPLLPNFDQAYCIWVALAGYLILRTALSRNPKFALVTAVMCSLITLGVLEGHPDAGYWAIQVFAVFLLLHSLRWIDTEHRGTTFLRLFAAMVWVVDAFVWQRSGGQFWVICAIAGFVLLACGAYRLISKAWGPRIIPIASILVMLARPGGITAEKAQSLPIGLLILIASFVFFGLGTVAALTRVRWHR